MKKYIFALASLALLALLLAGCGNGRSAGSEAPLAEPRATASASAEAAPSEAAEAEADPGMQDGERFEAVITIEGMEEPVNYEHVRNDTIGFEMDYDYERFERHSASDCERFISIWDDPADPRNYLELRYNPRDAETVAAAVREALSQRYDLLVGTRELDRAGSCIRIEASELKGTGTMADQLQVVYIIPAPDGCRIASAHFSAEAAEGFGRRISYFMNSFSVLAGQGEHRVTEEQALAAVRRYCHIGNPDLESIEKAGEYPVAWEVSSGDGQEIVVLFRSYTGAQIRYYIDPSSGDTYVTEFVPGISPEETQIDKRLNVWDYSF